MRRRSPSVLAALALVLALAACGGSGDATQGSVRDQVSGRLQSRDVDPITDDAEADEIGDCVAQAMFADESFSPDDRNDAARAVDGDAPDAELVAKVEALLDECGALPRSDEEREAEEQADPCTTAFEDVGDPIDAAPSDYVATLTACETVDDWAAAAAEFDAQLDLDDPEAAVANLCERAEETEGLCG
jgi:hypothetical protein